MTDANIDYYVTQDADRATDRNTKSKYWVFTRNNYTELDISLLGSLYETGYFSYLVYGREVGESGTRHLQGYIELSQRRRFTQVKAQLPGFYIASRRGTAQQAHDYCIKDGEFVQFGTISRPEQGRRKDLERVATMVKEGATIRQIAAEEPEAFIKYHKGIGALKDLLQPKYQTTVHTERWYNLDHDWTKTQIFHGLTNCGKTTYAIQLLPRALWCTHMDDLAKYNDEDYDGIIFDEACFLHLPREAQINLCDQDQDRSLHVRYMCARIPRNTKKIFTTNKPVDQVLLDDPAIMRRIQVQYIIKPDV